MERVKRLIKTRNQLAAAIAACESARDLAPLSREYRQVLRELDSLQPPQERRDGIDEITRRRAARAAGAAPEGGAGRSS
jgi:hypothetical protein